MSNILGFDTFISSIIGHFNKDLFIGTLDAERFDIKLLTQPDND